MPLRARFPPVGCNMNDAGYPFRGEYKMEPPLNHGHTGALRTGSTVLTLRITGANLVIEKLQQGKGQKLHCELGVDNGPTRTVVFPFGGGAVPVPGDGREYHLNAVVQGGGVKHQCKLILSGSEGKSVLRLRAPPDPRLTDSIILTIDGRRIRPCEGWYEIPIQAKECSLEMAEMEYPRRVSPSLAATQIPSAATFLLQTTAGNEDNVVLFCSGSGEALPLTPNRAVSVAVESGPFTFQLPRAPATQQFLPPGAFTSSYDEPVATDLSEPRVPELETMCVAAPPGDASPPTFVATAEGFMIELIGDNGASSSGYGTAQLRLPDRSEHRVRTILSDPSGRQLLRQSTVVPSTERASLGFSIAESAHGARFITGKHPCRISVDNHPPVSGDAGVYVDKDAPHVVTVRDDGLSAVFEIGPQRGPYPQPSAAAPTEVEPWIAELAKALQSSDLDTARRGIQGILPTTPEAVAICGFVSEQLFRKPPTLSFNKSNDTVNEIQCPGYGITAAVDNAPPCTIAAGGSVQVPAGHSITLTAVTPPMGRAVASCCLRHPPPDKNLDELLVARMLETFQRHSANPDKVISELSNITSAQSVNGQRLLPLLIDCLRRLTSLLQRPIYFRAAEDPESTQLFISLDDKQPMQLSPHSTTEVPRETNNVRVSLHRPSLPVPPSRNELAKALVDAFYLPSPPPLPVRWGSIPTEVPEERALLDLLLQLLRDHENELVRRCAQGGAVSLTDALQFTCEGGCLKNVRTERPCRLSVDVDGTGFMNLEQGGQIPLGYEFPPGSVHRIQILARDPVSGAPCAETLVTLMAPEVAKMPQQVATPVSCFLDASVLQLQEEVQLRLVCPQHLHIVCEVDGNGCGNTWKAEFVAKMSAARPHNVKVRLLDGAGGVVFEQRLALPPMMSPCWSVGLDTASLHVDAVNGGGGTLVKASLDRSPERELSAPLSFDSNAPHSILLRRYSLGQQTWDAYAGELALRIPAFVNPAHVEDVSRVYRTLQPGGNEELRTRLTELRSRTPSSVVQELISALIESLTGSPRAGRGNDSDVHIHFRLSGDESSFVR
ncbi:uncharacterized protein Tco025E_08011 [Trypanosoma conorhini]|uniref:Uncharacterized protein n=1 Tax=Trypanosoma conorhini TaxID=83891 RepID=A0A422NF95_9TRYP|nr:uncharacterized protein Tco025E_08011 [Trypanosoma conorhini]RNF04130.1 hypothetical protein Tco025E_08011 [Trypanosoma conorhini]